MLGDPGEIVRAQLRKKKQLKLPVQNAIGKEFNDTERISESQEVLRFEMAACTSSAHSPGWLGAGEHCSC
jgi:hypothetical protein